MEENTDVASKMPSALSEQFDMLEMTLQEAGVNLATEAARKRFSHDKDAAAVSNAKSHGLMVAVEMVRLIRDDIDRYYLIDNLEAVEQFPWQSVLRGVLVEPRELTPSEQVLADVLLRNKQEMDRLESKRKESKPPPVVTPESGSDYTYVYHSRAPLGTCYMSSQLRDYFLMGMLVLPKHHGSHSGTMEQIVRAITDLIIQEKGSLRELDLDLNPKTNKTRIFDSVVRCRQESMQKPEDGRDEAFLARIDATDRMSGWRLTPTGEAEAKQVKERHQRHLAQEAASEIRKAAADRALLPLSSEIVIVNARPVAESSPEAVGVPVIPPSGHHSPRHLSTSSVPLVSALSAPSHKN